MRCFGVTAFAGRSGYKADTGGYTHMERDKYLKLCQRASHKEAYAGAWWAANWDKSDLVRWRGDLYIPYDYRFGFQAGSVTGVAILHSARTCSAFEAPLKEVEESA